MTKKLWTAAVFGAAARAAAAATAGTSRDRAHFGLVRSTASVNAGCLVNATARVKIKNEGPVDVMTIDASGLPKNTEFDVFVTQLPNAPFGISWYQGNLDSNSHGKAHGAFVGRFSIETFTVAPGSGLAPGLHNEPIKDANSNPQFAPVHEYHVGVWFNSPTGAARPRAAPTSSLHSTATTMPAPRR